MATVRPFAIVSEATVSFTDVTTNNASTTKHGFLLKLDNSSTNFLNGQGAWAAPAASVTGFTSSQNTSSPNNTINASQLLVSAASDEADIVLSPKGGGSIVAHLADGASTGGNKRGRYSVDLVRIRDTAAQVASGYCATISGGFSNTASNSHSTVSGGIDNVSSNYYSVVSGGIENTASGQSSSVLGGHGNTSSGACSITGGRSNTASDNYSTVSGGKSNSVSSQYSTISGGRTNVVSGICSTLAGGKSNTVSNVAYSTISGGKSNTTSGVGSAVGGGYYNTASGVCSVISGGQSNTASGDNSSVPGGRRATTRGLYGVQAIASGYFATQGDAQRGQYILRGLTTNDTLKVLTADQGAASTTNQVILPNNSCYFIEAKVVSHRTDTVSGLDNRAIWTIEGVVSRDANAASTVVSLTVIAIYNTIGYALDAEVDTTNGGMKISFTGITGHTVRTVAVVTTTEVTS